MNLNENLLFFAQPVWPEIADLTIVSGTRLFARYLKQNFTDLINNHRAEYGFKVKWFVLSPNIQLKGQKAIYDINN